MLGAGMIAALRSPGVLAMALAGALFVAGWQQGVRAERAAWEARVATLAAERARSAARVAGLSEALRGAMAERAALARRLEALADADDDAGRVALPARSLRRLDSR